MPICGTMATILSVKRYHEATNPFIITRAGLLTCLSVVISKLHINNIPTCALCGNKCAIKHRTLEETIVRFMNGQEERCQNCANSLN